MDEIAEKVNDYNIQKGDLMYFIDEQGNVHHATIISSVINGKIRYSANTTRRYDYSLERALNQGEYGVYIIRINDELNYDGGNCIE